MTAANAPDITFVTTCRGRLEHLRQSLPRLLAQPGTACVVVDYDCPQHTADWVTANHPQVTVVRSGPRPHFEIGRARNLGAAAANTPWLCFVDADMLVPADFAERIRGQARPRQFLLLRPPKLDILGMCVCHRDDFAAVGGYDAALQGWGMDDKDLYVRLRMRGVVEGAISSEDFECIPHGDSARVEHYANKRRGQSSTLNFLYCRIKWDRMLLQAHQLPEPDRVALYAQVAQAFERTVAQGRDLSLNIPHHSRRSLDGSLVESSLVYRVSAAPKAPDPAPAPKPLP